MDPFAQNIDRPGMPMVPGINDWLTMGGGPGGMAIPPVMPGSQTAGQALLNVFRGPAPNVQPQPWASTTKVPDYATAGYDPTTQTANIPMPPQRPADLYASATAPSGGLGNAPLRPQRPAEFASPQTPQYVPDDGSNNAYWLNESIRQGGPSPMASMGTDAESKVGQGAQNFWQRLMGNADKADYKLIDDNSILGRLGNMGGPVQKGDGALPIFLKTLMNN